ncbi:hypothetical protein [Paenibacillus campinasensis]|uniref:Uncharacterized protein n=1 Tax=Paenibacillus campinasensis TaxID=66347 RepID=A0A268EL92_9BACL|nr:hypothetical protein [Paenibacillus campinasensis]PAD73897.1 hypothetical protein CHH67_18855 [Paenibacillus campinasensis]
MTCIAGIENDGGVYIGGDSAGVEGLSLMVRADEKVFRKGDFVMGFTSSFRMGQLLRYKLEIPYHRPGMGTYEFMVSEFVESVRRCLRDGGYSKTNGGEESGGTFLVGYRGQLFRVDDDYQVGRAACGYDAIGCGEDIAKGSLFTSARLDMSPSERLREALIAAENFSAGVRSPFLVVSTNKESQVVT